MTILFLSIIGIFISLIIFLYNHRNIYLAIFYLLTSLNILFLYFNFFSDQVILSAIIAVHTFPLFFLLGPTIWFYVRGEITVVLSLSRKDAWHFIPFALNVIQIIPYSLKPWSFKLIVASHLKTIDTSAILALDLPLISFRAYFFLRILFTLVYIFYCIHYLFKNLQTPFLLKDSLKIKWLKWFLSLIFLNLLINIFIMGGIIFSDASYPSKLWISISSFLGNILFLSTFLFPKVLYGQIIKNVTNANHLSAPSELELEDFTKILQKYIDERQYIYSTFAKSKILSESNVSNRLFTYYFNEHLQSSFTQWRNKYRLDYSMQLISEGYLKNYTIESLAKKVGFQSRNSFATSFKTQFGVLPSEKITL